MLSAVYDLSLEVNIREEGKKDGNRTFLGMFSRIYVRKILIQKVE